MATMRFEVTISKANGELFERYPARTKESANKRGRKIAREIGGTLTVKPIEPREYNPAEWN